MRSLLLALIVGVLASCRLHEDHGQARMAVNAAIIGQLTSLESDGIRERYEYDGLGRPTLTVTTIDGKDYSLTRQYAYPSGEAEATGLGTVLDKEILHDGEQIRFTYDVAGRTQTITSYVPGGEDNEGRIEPIVKRMVRNARGDTVRVHLANGTITKKDYDPDTLRLASIETRRVKGEDALTEASFDAGEPLTRQEYGFDPRGNVAWVGHSLAGKVSPLSARYDYDEKNQLIAATTGPRGGETTLFYEYDAVSRLMRHEGREQKYGLLAHPHAVSFAERPRGPDLGGRGPGRETLELAYDDSGDLEVLTSRDGDAATRTRFSWNAERMATTVERDGTVLSTKSFVGERLWKKVEAGRTTLYPNALVRIEDGKPRKEIAGWAERSPDDGELHFTYSDLLGTVTVITDKTGKVEHKAYHWAFGDDRADDVLSLDPGVTAYATPFGFNHKEREATGFYEYGARIYHPVLGRWASADDDPTDGLDVYGYVNNNPVTNVDPDGHQQRDAEQRPKPGEQGYGVREAAASYFGNVWNGAVGYAKMTANGINKITYGIYNFFSAIDGSPYEEPPHYRVTDRQREYGERMQNAVGVMSVTSPKGGFATPGQRVVATARTTARAGAARGGVLTAIENPTYFKSFPWVEEKVKEGYFVIITHNGAMEGVVGGVKLPGGKYAPIRSEGALELAKAAGYSGQPIIVASCQSAVSAPELAANASRWKKLLDAPEAWGSTTDVQWTRGSAAPTLVKNGKWVKVD
jgi:RHS repeat-associated protein